MSAQPWIEHGADRDAPLKLISKGFTLQLGEFACEALAVESARLGVSSEELVSFSVMYYLADFDSGRAARRRPTHTPSTRPPGPEACARSELSRPQALRAPRRP